MDVLSFSDNFSISVLNDTLISLATGNQGQYRVYVRFLKEMEKMPLFGVYIQKQAVPLWNLPFQEIQNGCWEIELKDDPVYQRFHKRGASVGEMLIFDFRFKECEPLTLMVRAKMMARNKTFSNWTGFLQTGIHPAARFCLMMGHNEFEIWDSRNFDNFWLGLENRCRRSTHHCCVCLNNIPLANIVYQHCGHGFCSHCFATIQKCPMCNAPLTRELRARNRVTPCPIDGCHQPFEGNHYMVIPCGCLITHNFTGEDKDRMSGQSCPYKMCERRIDEVIKIFITRGDS